MPSELTHRVKLRPFTVPNFVLAEGPAYSRIEGPPASMSYRLADLETETLAALCDDFRRSVFEKAGKADPHAK